MSGEPLSEFKEGQWWVKELDAMKELPGITLDQKRAVAVVHNLLGAIEREYPELVADRERLDWMFAHNGKLLKCRSPAISCNAPDRWVFHGSTPRDAIDQAKKETATLTGG